MKYKILNQSCLLFENIGSVLYTKNSLCGIENIYCHIVPTLIYNLNILNTNITEEDNGTVNLNILNIKISMEHNDNVNHCLKIQYSKLRKMLPNERYFHSKIIIIILLLLLF